eukprot:CAMPEP_0197716108 /NCGR_PEP_ID=MMETSP1434-20131217/1115_1 /TAXON_ID=265543 /ORGANISM="Minutocellus polymorphus, Strain CCMP3303" /LENGTH=325 /DNA_ID=CAMNT_0043300415 /DNA_START=32 /DNA_END=1009 /DNA_ORIENTATION=-
MTSTNPLSALATPRWIGDGTDGATLLSDDVSSVTFGTAKRGTPYNVRLNSSTPSPPSPTDNLYYEIALDEVVESGNLAVGFVTPDKFLPGWKTRGMFYNGNLTNGSAGLRMGFGAFLKAGDTVGSYLIRDADDATVKIVFYLNGRCLGPGFVIPSCTDVFYPCLHLDGKAKVTYSAPASFPSVIDREPSTFDDPYSGDWLLKQVMTGPELQELPLPDEAKIVLGFGDNDGGTYRLSIKVANTFNTSVKIVGKMEAFDKIEVGPAMSTRMMPPPILEPMEQFLGEGLETLCKMIVSADGNLILTGPAAEMICERYEKSFDPVTSYN